MAETAQHKRLVAGLVDYLRRQGVRVTHAAGGFDLPDPHAVGRHEPDAIGIKAGVLWFGEAKTGDGDLDSQHASEQLHDFSHRVMRKSRQACPFVLCVPKAAVDSARAALRHAGANTSVTNVVA